MIQKSFDAIDRKDIDVLIDDSVHESKTLEYKETLPGNAGVAWASRPRIHDEGFSL